MPLGLSMPDIRYLQKDQCKTLTYTSIMFQLFICCQRDCRSCSLRRLHWCRWNKRTCRARSTVRHCFQNGKRGKCLRRVLGSCWRMVRWWGKTRPCRRRRKGLLLSRCKELKSLQNFQIWWEFCDCPSCLQCHNPKRILSYTIESRSEILQGQSAMNWRILFSYFEIELMSRRWNPQEVLIRRNIFLKIQYYRYHSKL